LRLASFRTRDTESYGVVDGERVIDVGYRLVSQYPTLRLAVAALGVPALDEAARASEVWHRANDVAWLPPIPDPPKVICVGLNYRSHVQETGRQPPKRPLLFTRFANSQVGHEAELRHPGISTKYDYEGELAVVIGRKAHRVPAGEALECVLGYTCFNDGSVRDWQEHSTHFTAGKNFVASGACGPWIVTADEIPEPSVLQLETRVNGESWQRAPISDLVFSVPDLISYCSMFTELLPGDVIATGTPGGVGAWRKPVYWLKIGDVVEVEISGIGVLRNKVAGSDQPQQ
jgi:2-keto-4-pentenoate hydratase/2-oxohepta-3-ene-1,7-dioic acid hydratase in catechol pathway